MRERYFSLDEICAMNDFVLVDTCAFIHCFNFEYKGMENEEKVDLVKAFNTNLCFWISRIPFYNQIYSTEKVINEIRNCDYKYNKSIKLPIRRKEKKIPELRRELAKNKKYKFNLAALLEDNKRILILDKKQKEDYGVFSIKYFYLKEKIKETDFDLLISGGVLSKNNRVSIISSDFGIADAWRLFLKEENFPKRNFYFYSSLGFNFFERIIL